MPAWLHEGLATLLEPGGIQWADRILDGVEDEERGGMARLVLAHRLEQCLTLSAAERQAMGQRAIAHVAESFTLEAMKRGTLRVYDRLIGTSLERSFDRH